MSTDLARKAYADKMTSGKDGKPLQDQWHDAWRAGFWSAFQFEAAQTLKDQQKPVIGQGRVSVTIPESALQYIKDAISSGIGAYISSYHDDADAGYRNLICARILNPIMQRFPHESQMFKADAAIPVDGLVERDWVERATQLIIHNVIHSGLNGQQIEDDIRHHMPSIDANIVDRAENYRKGLVEEAQKATMQKARADSLQAELESAENNLRKIRKLLGEATGLTFHPSSNP